MNMNVEMQLEYMGGEGRCDYNRGPIYEFSN